MPPDGSPKPSATLRSAFVASAEQMLAVSCDLKDPGRVTLRRLNREEYDNTVRDLIGLDLRPADDFPSDDVGYGFDNIGDVLSISPLLMEKYISAAEMISEKAIEVPKPPITIAGSDLPDAKAAGSNDRGEKVLFSNTVVEFKATLPKAGMYRLRVKAYGEQAGPQPPAMALRFEGKEVQLFDVVAKKDRPEIYEVPIKGGKGENVFGISYLNDFYDAKQPAGQRDRNLVIQRVEIVGPDAGGEGISAAHLRIIPETPTKERRTVVARQIFTKFATRAFRRPATADEVDRLMKVYAFAEKTGEPFERGIQLGVQAVLVSPNFLFRVETDPPTKKNAAKTLNDYELASRLSYFLWSSMPDQALISSADSGRLHQPNVLVAQVSRMLQDPKSKALADNFAGQWLQLRKLNNVNPNPEQFPTFTPELKQNMVTETKMFFQAVAHEDRSIIDFIDGKFTYINGPLARHYGIPGVTGDVFRKVILTTPERGGVLTQGSVLTVTSNPTRTSPVKRGKWVLEELLGTPPPPPPPGVGTLGDERKRLDAKTLRLRMEQHRANPMCAACHKRMDPIGFSLENYDAVGAWRTLESGMKIDNSGVLPDGRTFHGPSELKKILLGNKPQFVRCLTEKMLTYALGRGLESADRCTVDDIVKRVTLENYKFSSLVKAVVKSEPFRKRRGDGAKAS